MSAYRREACEALACARTLGAESGGADAAIPLQLAEAGVLALLSIADELRALRTELTKEES